MGQPELIRRLDRMAGEGVVCSNVDVDADAAGTQKTAEQVEGAKGLEEELVEVTRNTRSKGGGSSKIMNRDIFLTPAGAYSPYTKTSLL